MELFLLLFVPLLSLYEYSDKRDYVNVSILMLGELKNGKETSTIQKDLADISLEELAIRLDTDAKRKTFWINVYNSFIIIILQKDPALYAHRTTFFTQKRINIAGNTFSFDDIEHGIIRRSKLKIGMGLIENPFPGKMEQLLRVEKTDPRIHFALNCGAGSCPPVRIYHTDTIDQELDEATKDYLSRTMKYDSETQVLTTTPLMSWFSGDFGNKKGILAWYKKFDLLDADAQPKIKCHAYDWTLDIDKFEV